MIEFDETTFIRSVGGRSSARKSESEEGSATGQIKKSHLGFELK